MPAANPIDINNTEVTNFATTEPAEVIDATESKVEELQDGEDDD